MNFQQWQAGIGRPVYKAQCVTWKRALELLQIAAPTGERGLATRGDSILATFRAFPQYREPHAKALRDVVALSIRMERLSKRIA